jgi:hypothetical protein
MKIRPSVTMRKLSPCLDLARATRPVSKAVLECVKRPQTKAMLSTLDAARGDATQQITNSKLIARALFLTHFKHSLGGGRLMRRTGVGGLS